MTHSDPPLGRNHFTAFIIWKESHRKICKTRALPSELLSGPSATTCWIHHLKEKLAQRSLLLLLRFLLCVQELSQGTSECCRKTEGKSCTKEPPMQCNATFKVLRARMKWGSRFQQDKEKPELVQVFQAQKKVLRMERPEQKKQVQALGTAGCWACADCLWRGFLTSAIWGLWDSP